MAARRRRLLAVLLLAALPALAAARPGRGPESPENPAVRVAGRWVLTLEGLSVPHREIQALLWVEGEILTGTLTVGNVIAKIRTGRLHGERFVFTFRHGTGETFRLRGSAGNRGLEGEWEALGEKGKWRGRRRGP